MSKQNSLGTHYDAHVGRITRARAAASRANGVFLPSISSAPLPDRKKQQGSKRVASNENSDDPSCTGAVQRKRRVALKDVSNICGDNSSKPCNPSAKVKSQVQTKRGRLKSKSIPNSKNSKIVPSVSVDNASDHDIIKANISSDHGIIKANMPSDHDIIKANMSIEVEERGILEPRPTTTVGNVAKDHLTSQHVENSKDVVSTNVTALPEAHSFRDGDGVLRSLKHGCFKGSEYIDIDTDNANPQMCCEYAVELYTNLQAAELTWRTFPNFMETLQRDINQNMRGILIDWLVEVAEEYKLVPDTLYLTVYIIDKYLSQNFIERQRLQLLGITSMLIASKYEEICAPRVEEFCFITDNTYSKAEVLNMEKIVLNYLSFRLSVPTIKAFLRRYLRAAQAGMKVDVDGGTKEDPALTLSCLANYLAELTLVESSFIKFLPSVIAASAIFLARWTLDQSNHPWNQTLEHYTSYKSIDLKTVVVAMQELQMNIKKSSLVAIREKYKQQKFESVAALTSPELLQSLFS